MTISTNDIKLRTPERLTDLADGGGQCGVGYLVSVGLLTQAQADAVLHYDIPATE